MSAAALRQDTCNSPNSVSLASRVTGMVRPASPLGLSSHLRHCLQRRQGWKSRGFHSKMSPALLRPCRVE